MNVLALTLAVQRSIYYQRCWATILSLAGYGFLVWLDWRAAAGVFCVQLATVTTTRLNGGVA